MSKVYVQAANHLQQMKEMHKKIKEKKKKLAKPLNLDKEDMVLVTLRTKYTR